VYLANNDDNTINGCIDCFSSKLRVVTMSAFESELAGMYMCMQRCTWLRDVLRAFGFPQGPTLIVTDNTVAIAFAENTCKLSQSKSIDIRFHWIRDRVKQGHFKLAYVPGTENIADFFTKPLSADDHHRWMPLLAALGPEGAYTPDLLPPPKIQPTWQHWKKGA
jgi:hypothetical protein